jgi:thiamine biosynthesis lipoprotein
VIVPPALLQAAPQERQGLAMGTVLRMQAEGPGAAAALESAWKECGRIEAACSTWRADSAWSRLNAAGGQPVEMDPEWIELFKKAKSFSDHSQGTFDPVLGALLSAWRVREGGKAPTAQVLARAKQASGARLLMLNAEGHTAQLLHPLAGVEEGGFVKGYALDGMAAEMVKAGATDGLLDLGGQLLVFGTAREVFISDPKRRHQARYSVWLQHGSLATSSASERGRHILDPRSGKPCPAWGSVSVIASTGLEADMLTKPCYVMGPVKGWAWAEKEGVAALFQSNDGTVRMTTAFKALHPVRIPRR